MNLPEAKSGRWSAGLTAAKMTDCRWLKPVLVAPIEFRWTGENHLRHTKSLRYVRTNPQSRFAGSSVRRSRPRPSRSILEGRSRAFMSRRTSITKLGQIAVSERGTSGGLTQFLTQFDVSGSATSL